jgi:hypothetical protein
MRNLFIFLLISLCPVTAFAEPSIVFDSEKHNFGTVAERLLEHPFIFTNTGDEDLIIDSLTPS